MTVGVAWIRRAARGQELWFAADSRLGGDGNQWDCCPKIFLLPRRDAVAGFAGQTAQAYPLMLQIANAMLGYAPAETGALEFTHLVGHLERTTNVMMRALRSDPLVNVASEPSEFQSRSDAIVIGGFSRMEGGFILRRLRYAPDTSTWVFGGVDGRPQQVGLNKPFVVYGDRGASPKFDYLLTERLRERGKLGTDAPFDLEPLEVLWEYLLRPSSPQRPTPDDCRPPTVGGSPQVAVTLAGATATPLAVRWTDGDYVLGRPCLLYENLTIPLVEHGPGPNELRLVAPGLWRAAGRPGETEEANPSEDDTLMA